MLRSAGRLSRYCWMLVTYTVMRAMCSGLPPAARTTASTRDRAISNCWENACEVMRPSESVAVWPATNKIRPAAGASRP